LPARRKPRKTDKEAAVETSDDRPVGRGIWSGSITFGLVTIPVELHSATHRELTPMRMLGPKGAPLKRRFACPEHDEILEDEDIVRGYEIEDGEFVLVTDDELEALAPRRSRDIDLQRFVPRSSIDPAYFERAYVLVPGQEQTKAYRLLAETMERTGRAAIATFVMREKAYAVAIFSDHGVMRAVTLRFADEVRSPKEVGLPAPQETDKKRTSAMKRLVASHAKAALVDAELEELESDEVLRLAEKKLKQGEDVVEVEEEPREDEPAEGGEVVDLMAKIRERLRAPPTRTKSPRAKTPRRTKSKRVSATKSPRARARPPAPAYPRGGRGKSGAARGRRASTR
jgi:DNA end-binding protein Ku